MSARRFAALTAALSLFPTALLAPPAEAATLAVSNEVTQVTVMMVENHSAAQIRDGMPQTTALADRFAHGTGLAFAHPSKPNYLGVWSGSMQGEKSNRKAYEKAPSYFDVVPAKTGQMVKTYAQSMKTACRTSRRGRTGGTTTRTSCSPRAT
jgi:hypothetical protein